MELIIFLLRPLCLLTETKGTVLPAPHFLPLVLIKRQMKWLHLLVLLSIVIMLFTSIASMFLFYCRGLRCVAISRQFFDLYSYWLANFNSICSVAIVVFLFEISWTFYSCVVLFFLSFFFPVDMSIVWYDWLCLNLLCFCFWHIHFNTHFWIVVLFIALKYCCFMGH